MTELTGLEILRPVNYSILVLYSMYNAKAN